MNRLSSIVIAALTVLAGTPAAESRMDVCLFPHQKPLERAEGAGARVGLFELDNAIYAATDARYANLRITDEGGAEVPFHLRQKIHAVTQIVETAISSRLLGFEEKSGNQARVLVEVEKPGGGAEVVLLRTGNQNYEKLCAVYGGNSLDRWEPLVRDVRVFDYSRHIDVRNNRIDLPPNGYKYLRIDIANFVEQKKPEEFEVTTEERGELAFSKTERRTMREESIRIEGIELRAKSAVVRPDEPFRSAYAGSNLTVKADEQAQTSVWTFGTDRQPLVSLSLETASQNFSRRVTVEGSRGGDKPTWDWLGEATLFSVDFGNAQDRQLTIPLARESRYEQYRVVVYNQDNPSMDVSGVIATGLVYEALFMADPTARYGALYGGKDVPAPRYDVESVLKNVPTLETVTYVLGDEFPNPLYKAGYRTGGITPKVLFAIAMAAMIALLVWFIAKGAGKVEQLK